MLNPIAYEQVIQKVSVKKRRFTFSRQTRWPVSNAAIDRHIGPNSTYTYKEELKKTLTIRQFDEIML